MAGGISVSFAWPDHKIAVTLDLVDDERAAVSGEGWTLLDPADDDFTDGLAILTGRD